MMKKNSFLLPLSLFGALSALHAYKPGDPVPADYRIPDPLSLEESVASIKIPSGFALDLVASEPLVLDPINLDWGPDGKLWVVEMSDYPLGIGPEGKPGGRVRYLEDADGDGRYDTSTLFLDGLSYPTDVKPWRNGVLITAAPDIVYAEDTDGDGRADATQVLYTGFIKGNPQHLVNGLQWGLDNWIHVANGDSNGVVRSLKTGETVDISGRDLKIRPNGGEMIPLTGRTQYGRIRDDWGNWFGSNNSKPIFHFVLPDHYTQRNPYVPISGSVALVPDIPLAPPIFSISQKVERFNDPDKSDRVTGACGLMIYRDTLLGDDFYGDAFVCESVHNLVHRRKLSRKGMTFLGTRAPGEETSEFLASSDLWFRPTAAKAGPDGALWVVDMHRYVIEHPEWIPEEWMAVVDLRAGEDRGRIYRVMPANKKPHAIPRYDKLDAKGLVSLLESPSGWQRDKAQELLVERQDKRAIPLLEGLMRGSSNPLARLHALCSLDGLGVLTAAHVDQGLKDAHPEVRRHAVRLSEGFAGTNPELLDRMAGLVEDAHPQLLMQLAFSLGEWKDSQAGEALARLASLHGEDPDLMGALMSAALPHMPILIRESSRKGQRFTSRYKSDLMALALARDDQTGLALLLKDAIVDGDSEALGYGRLAQLMRALEGRKSSLELLARQADAELKEIVERCRTILELAPGKALDGKESIETRLAAIDVLGKSYEGVVTRLEPLGKLLGVDMPLELQLASVRRVRGLNHPKAWLLALERLPAMGSEARSQTLGAMLERSDSTYLLLDVLEKGELSANLVDIALQNQLLNVGNDTLRGRAERVFGTTANVDRHAALKKYDSVYSLKGDADSGKQLFASVCSSCHRMGDTGRHVGPDIMALTDRSVQAMLAAIILPNQAVEDKFRLYQLSMADGTQMVGMLRSETSNSITIAGMDGVDRVVLRGDIRSLTTSGKSMMPEGLEAILNPQQMADLCAFLGQ